MAVDLLSKLRELTPGLIYGSTSLQNIKAASHAFCEGYIRKYEWRTEERLSATFASLPTNTDHEIELSNNGGKLESVCTCSWDRPGERCHHAVAAMMGICYLLRGATFQQTPPKNWHKPRSAELLAACGESDDVLPALIINADESVAKGKLVLCYQATPLAAVAEMHQAPAALRDLLLRSWPMIHTENLIGWMRTKSASNVATFIIHGGKKIRITEVRPLDFVAKTRIKATKEKVMIEKIIASEAESGNAAELVRLDESLCYHSGLNRFGVLVSGDWNLAYKLEPSGNVGRKKWNEHAIALPENAPLSYSDALFEPAPVEEAPEFVILVQSGTDGFFLTQISMSLDGTEIPLGQSLVRIFDTPFASEKYLRSQRSRLWLGIAEWLSLDEVEARQEQATQIADVLELSGLERVKFLRHFDGFEKAIERAVQSIFVVGKGEWRSVGSAFWTACRLFAGILRSGETMIDRAEGLPMFRAEEFRTMLRNLRESSVLQAKVSYDGGEVSANTLAMRIKATQIRPDWFELTPEVTCEGELVPANKWREILSQGYWKRPDGGIVLFEDASTDALAKLDLLAKVDSSATECTVQANRLEILDWLMLRKAGIECELPPEAEGILGSLLNFESLPILPVPPRLQAELRHYQLEGYSWLSFLYRHRFGACLADDMGLGKTLQTIALIAELGPRESDSFPHLLVMPPTLVFNWRNELDRFLPGMRIRQLDSKTNSLDGFDIIVAGYEMVRRRIEWLEQKQFDLLVFDEAQAVKNVTGERAQAMRRLKGRFKLCLTGTPMENHAGEYFAIMDLALPGIYGNYRGFRERVGAGQSSLIQRGRPFILRRKKEKILQELPAKTETNLFLEPSANQRAFYTRALADVKKEIAEAYGEKTSSQAGVIALAALTRLRQICVSPALLDPEQTEPSPKMEYLSSALAELADEGHAALVFSQFTKALNLVEAQVKEANINYIRLDGSTPMKKRADLVQSFQDPAGPPIFLISLKTGGAGLNLTRASYVFHLDPWWNPASESQATDRAHRIGQLNPVLVRRLLMTGTVEEKIEDLKRAKKELFSEIVEGNAMKGASHMVREDFERLLS